MAYFKTHVGVNVNICIKICHWESWKMSHLFCEKLLDLQEQKKVKFNIF